MAISARWVQDSDRFPWYLRQTKGVWEGLRTYQVNTSGPELAFKALGLPAYGDPWSEAYKNLTVEDLDWAPIGGFDAAEDGTAGWCKVTVRYREPSGTAFVKADPRKAYTFMATRLETVYTRVSLKRFDSIDGEVAGREVVGPLTLINGGDGAPIQVATTSVQVVTWHDVNRVPDWGRFVRLARPCKTNQAPTHLPPIYGTNIRIPVGKGELLYLGFDRPELDQNYLKVIHNLEASRDFLYRWQAENSKGEAVGDIKLDQVYPEGDFTGLWPGA